MAQNQVSSPGRGGARPGAGRKPKYGSATKTVRVPEDLELRVQEFIDSLVNVTDSNNGSCAPGATEPIDFDTQFKNELQKRIDDLLPRIAIKERAIAAKHFKKLLNGGNGR